MLSKGLNKKSRMCSPEERAYGGIAFHHCNIHRAEMAGTLFILDDGCSDARQA